jgi:hypothetical protein
MMCLLGLNGSRLNAGVATEIYLILFNTNHARWCYQQKSVLDAASFLHHRIAMRGNTNDKDCNFIDIVLSDVEIPQMPSSPTRTLSNWSGI